MAKLSLSKESFKRALDIVTATLHNNTTMPILKGIKFQIQGNVLAAYTNSTTAFSLSYLNVESDEDFYFVVEGALFANLIKRLKADKVELEVKESNLVIKTENFETLLPVLKADEFPDVPKIEGADIKVNTDHFLRSVNLTSVSCSDNNLRPILKSVHLEGRDKKIFMTALDGYRLSNTSFSIKEEIDDFAVNIPANELTRITKNINDEEIAIVIDSKSGYFIIKHGAAVRGVKLMEGEFIDYKQVIPKKKDATLVVGLEIDNLRNGLDLINVFKTETVKFNIKDEQFILDCSNDKGQIKKKIEIISKEGEDLDISFNPLFFNVLTQLNSYGDKIMMYFTKPLAPITFEPIGSGFDFTYLVLPKRTIESTTSDNSDKTVVSEVDTSEVAASVS